MRSKWYQSWPPSQRFSRELSFQSGAEYLPACPLLLAGQIQVSFLPLHSYSLLLFFHSSLPHPILSSDLFLLTFFLFLKYQSYLWCSGKRIFPRLTFPRLDFSPRNQRPPDSENAGSFLVKTNSQLKTWHKWGIMACTIMKSNRGCDKLSKNGFTYYFGEQNDINSFGYVTKLTRRSRLAIKSTRRSDSVQENKTRSFSPYLNRIDAILSLQNKQVLSYNMEYTLWETNPTTNVSQVWKGNW